MKHVEYFNIKFLVTNITKRLFSLCWQILQNAPQNKQTDKPALSFIHLTLKQYKNIKSTHLVKMHKMYESPTFQTLLWMLIP